MRNREAAAHHIGQLGEVVGALGTDFSPPVTCAV
jgi:hypothetical protein